MTMTDDMPALSKDLEAMLRAEGPIPSPPGGLQERVFGKLADTLAWGGPGTGGGGATGGLSGTTFLLLAVLMAAGIGGAGFYALRSDTGVNSHSSAAPSGVDPLRIRSGSSNLLPSWFGEADRPSRDIAGRVTFLGEPVPGAKVVIQSEMIRAGVVASAERTADKEGWFSFGAQRAAWYDISASAPGMGYGHVQVATHDPNVVTDELSLRLSGCEHALHGVVRDPSGGVIAGADVRATRGDWHNEFALGVGAVSDQEGRYELCSPAGKLGVVISAQGYGAMRIKDTIIGRKQFDVELVPEAVVLGRVVESRGGKPIAGMGIRLYPAAWPQRLRTTTAVAISDSEGRFRIAGLAPGRHTLYAQDRGHVVRPTPILIHAGSESPEVLLHADDRLALRGKVVESGQAVGGARIFSLIGGLRQGGSTIADADGEFSLWPVAEGSIQFEVEGYLVTSPLEHEVSAATLDRPLVITVARLGAIRGKVLHGGAPIANAEVRASGDSQARTRSDRTDEDGVFELRGLAAGNYELTASSDAAVAFSTTSQEIRLGAQEERNDVVIDLDGTATIRGAVLDQNDATVEGVVVQYTDARTGDACTATSDLRGEFVCGPLSGGGSYLPSVRPDTSSAIAFPGVKGARFEQVMVEDGSSRLTGQVLHIQANRERISGRVVSQDGSPHPDTTVRAIEASTGYTPATAPWLGLRTGVSAADGSFQITVWKGARYTLHARAPSGGEGTLVNVRAGSSGIAIQIAEPGNIEGTLLGFDGPPELLVRRLGNTVEFVAARADSSSFSAQGLTPGQYAVLALSGSRGTGQTVEVRSGQSTSIVLKAGPSARLELQVIDFQTGEPVAGVRCKAAPYIHDAGIFGWGTPLAEPTDAQGSVSLDVPSGSIEIACQPRQLRHSEGAAQMHAKGGQANRLAVYVVVSDTPEDSSNGIGAHFHMGFNVQAGGYTHTLVQIRPGGAGEQAGLRVDDMIVQIDGRDVSPLTDLVRLMGTYGIGSTIELTVRRAQVLRTLSVVVEAPWH